MRTPGVALALLLVASFAHAAPPTSGGAIVLSVDASLAAQKTFHSRLVIPVAPGPLTLYYPKWIPAYHAPYGPVLGVAGIRMSANGAPLEWRRDDVDMYALHVVVPPATAAITVDFDMVTQNDDGLAFSSAKLALMDWNQHVFYPAGRPTDSIRVVASVTLPPGWHWASAMHATAEHAGIVQFAPVSLTTLVDSPVQMGEYLRAIALNPGDPRPVYADLAADSPEALDVDSTTVRHWRALVDEAGALFGARHYREYHFLMTLSDHVAGDGIEHHESTDIRDDEASLTDPQEVLNSVGTICHEYVHSWNGKYRRPVGLAPTDYQQPLLGDLLWIYEGLTECLGQILTARSGFHTPEQYREKLAMVTGRLDAKPGRTWRPLLDTAVEAQLLYDAPVQGGSWRRKTDFYDEGMLIWLEVDATLRRESHGTKSLDDFCRRFHGGTSGPPAVSTYTLGDVVATLDSLAPYDWRGLLTQRVDRIQAHPPTRGIEAEGWRLVYRDTISEYQQGYESGAHMLDTRWSLGMLIGSSEGEINDVAPGSPAAKAGLAPGGKIVAVNGRRWSKEHMRAALVATAKGRPLEVLVETGEFFRSHAIVWKGGERYPWLERIPSTPDVLSQLIAPLTAR